MNLCINCKFYHEGEKVEYDTCLHPTAKGARNCYDGVREKFPQKHFSCDSMRFGLCSDGQLFEVKV